MRFLWFVKLLREIKGLKPTLARLMSVFLRLVLVAFLGLGFLIPSPQPESLSLSLLYLDGKIFVFAILLLL
jgi:hypothetical protein